MFKVQPFQGCLVLCLVHPPGYTRSYSIPGYHPELFIFKPFGLFSSSKLTSDFQNPNLKSLRYLITSLLRNIATSLHRYFDMSQSTLVLNITFSSLSLVPWISSE